MRPEPACEILLEFTKMRINMLLNQWNKLYWEEALGQTQVNALLDEPFFSKLRCQILKISIKNLKILTRLVTGYCGENNFVYSRRDRAKKIILV